MEHCDAGDGSPFYIFTESCRCYSCSRLKQMNSQPVQKDVGGRLTQISSQFIGRQLTQMGSQSNQTEDVHNDSYLSSFPPGYRFLPTDSELLVHYLAKKIDNQPLQPNRIVETELYKFHPEELIKNKMQRAGPWYFFTPREKKYLNGSRPSRSASMGYWKATGKDKDVLTDDNIRVGFKRSLVFYEGKSPGGVKTKWLMHEYKLDNPPKRQKTGPQDIRLDDCVLCKIYQKNKKREENDAEHVEVEHTNYRSPIIMMGQNIDNIGGAGDELPVSPFNNYGDVVGELSAATCEQVHVQGQNIKSGDAGGGLPVAPLQQVYVHGQKNIYSYGNAGGELSASPFNNYGDAVGELPDTTFEQVNVQGQNINSSDSGGGLPVAPLSQVYVRGQNNNFNYGDAGGELFAAPIDNYGDAGGELSNAPADNYGYAGGELPVAPLQQVYVHGQNVYNHGDASGELSAAPIDNYGDAGGELPAGPFNNYGDVVGELHAAFEQVHVQGENINSGDAGGGFPIAPIPQVYVHGENNIYNYGDVGGEFSAACMDNYGDAGSELPAATFDQVHVQGQNPNSGDAGGELPVAPLQQLYGDGQNIYNHGDVGGGLSAAFEKYQNIANYYGDTGGKLSASFKQVHDHNPSKTFNYLGEIIFLDEEDESDDKHQDQISIDAQGLQNISNCVISSVGGGLQTLDVRGFETLDDGGPDISNSLQRLLSNDRQQLETLFEGLLEYLSIEEQRLISNGSQGFEVHDGGGFDISNGGQGFVSKISQGLEQLDGGDIDNSNGS